MKKTQFIDLIKIIKSTFVSFFSVTLFVTLGVGVFLGMSWGGRGLAMSIAKAQDDNNFRDLEIISPYGFTDDDMRELRKVEGVADVEGTYTAYAYFYQGDIKLQAKICTVPEDINKLFSFEGSMPSKPNEIIVEKFWANARNIKIGDTITFLHDTNDHPHALSMLLENEDKINDVEALVKLFEDDKPDDDGMQSLKFDKFTVSGLAETPDNISSFTETYGTSSTYGTPVDIIMFFPMAAFDEKSFTGYTNILVKSDYLEGIFLDKEFRDANDEFKDRVDVKVKELTEAKNKKILEISGKLKSMAEEAPKQVEEAERQIESGKKEIEINERLVNEGDKQINTGRAMLEAGKQMLEQTRDELNEKIEQFEPYLDKVSGLASMASRLADRLEAIVRTPEADKVLELIKKNIDDETIDTVILAMGALANLFALTGNEYTANSINDMIGVMSSLQVSTREARTQFQNLTPEQKNAKVAELKSKLNYYISVLRSVAAIEDSITDRVDEYIAQMEERLAEAIRQVEENEAQVNSSQATLNSGRRQINEGKKQIEDYQAQLDKMKELLGSNTARQLSVATSDLKDYSSAILTKSNNPTSASSMTLVDIFNGVKFSLAALFFIVGILVCYSALSRIIFSHIKLLGTKKALGLMKREITLSYLLYGGISVTIGCTLGILLGYYVLEPVIVMVLRKSFVSKDMVYFAEPKEAIIICALEVVFILLTTYLACRSLLKEHPVVLLAGPQPPSGKHRFFEKFRLWKKLSLFSKTMVNNLLMDKRRVLGTLIGIMGCTSMLVAGATIKLNSDKSADIEFNTLTKFDQLVLFDGKKEGAKEGIKKVLDDNEIPSSSFLKNCMRIVLPDGRVNICYIFVSDDEKFSDYFILRNNKGHIKQMADGVRVCNGYPFTYDVDPGDQVEFIDNTGQHFFVPYIGEYENYNPNISVVMPADTYERYSKDKYIANSFTINTQGVDMEKLESELEKVPGFITLYNYVEANMNGFNSIASATLVISAVAVVLATVMAFLVLLNLLVMQVEEKKREMIILMINGYSVREAKKYVYKDTIFLTIIGITLGCLLGDFVGNWNMRVLSYLPAHFYEGVNWIAIGFGIVAAAVLALINALIAMRRIKYFKLTDINK